jgi:hypothetical protein
MRRDAVHHVLLQPPDSEGSPMSGLRLVASYAFLLAAIIIMHCGSVLLQLQGWSSDPAGQHVCCSTGIDYLCVVREVCKACARWWAGSCCIATQSHTCSHITQLKLQRAASHCHSVLAALGLMNAASCWRMTWIYRMHVHTKTCVGSNSMCAA